MEHFTVQSSNAALACQEAGKGPAAVLLHAGVADRRSWSATMTKLESTGRLIAYDRRGSETPSICRRAIHTPATWERSSLI